jgi:hypothetical protein
MSKLDLLVRLETKTASYKITSDDLGKFFTNPADGDAIVFTLPTTADLPVGWWCEFYSRVAQDFTVAAETLGDIVTFNDLTADAIVFSTSGDEIGNYLKVVWDGTSWLTILGVEGAVVVTVTSA